MSKDGTWHTAIIGGGPAGVSCALWLKLLGFRPVLIEAGPAVGGRLADSPYPNPWVAAAPPDATGLTLAGTLAANLAAQDIALRSGAAVEEVACGAEGFTLRLAGGDVVAARTVVVATGLKPETGGLEMAEDIVFGPGRIAHDAAMAGRRVAILGGGDNAFDHAALALARGAARVGLFARSIRARPPLVAAVPEAMVARGPAQVDTRARSVNGEAFDLILVMYGFTPSIPALAGLAPERDHQGYLLTDAATARTSEPGLYAVGDAARRAHPCVPTALADGVVAAKAVEAALTVRGP